MFLFTHEVQLYNKGQQRNGGTIPPHILVTSFRPDIFMVDETARVCILFELTCPWDKNIDRSHTYKEDKYSPLVADLSQSFTVFHYSVEVSVRGQLTGNNRARLKSFIFKKLQRSPHGHQIYDEIVRKLRC